MKLTFRQSFHSFLAPEMLLTSIAIFRHLASATFFVKDDENLPCLNSSSASNKLMRRVFWAAVGYVFFSICNSIQFLYHWNESTKHYHSNKSRNFVTTDKTTNYFFLLHLSTIFSLHAFFTSQLYSKLSKYFPRLWIQHNRENGT